MKRIVNCFIKVMLALVLCFSVVDVQAIHAADTVTYATITRGQMMQELMSRIREALLSGEESIDVSDLGIDTSTQDWASDTTIIPYFGNGISGSIYKDGTVLRTYYFSTKLTQSEVVEYVKKIDTLLADVNDKVSQANSDVERALIVHDYMASQLEYDYDNLQNGTVPSTSYTAGGILSTGIGVCQGYAELYEYFMTYYNIECHITTSTAMNHAWNIVKIGSSYYHVDVTWDDPVEDNLGFARHNHFLLSDTAMATKRGGSSSYHYGWDLKSTYSCSSTTYDDYWWYGVNSPIEVYNGSYYYVSSDYKVIKRTRAGATTTLATTGRWPASGGNWVGTFSGLFIEGGYLYYNNAKNIIAINLSNTATTVKIGSTLSSPYYFGIQYKNGKIYYETDTDPNGDGTVTVSNQVPNKTTRAVTAVEVYPSSLDMVVGQSKNIYALVIPANATSQTLTYTSGNTSVVTVSSSGVVKAVGAGSTTITVSSSNGKTATVSVTVANKVAQYLVITTGITKTTYIQNVDQLDVTGGKMKLIYNDNSVVENIDMSKATITGFDNSVLGKQTLTVSYGGVSTTMQVTVIAKAVSSIEVVEMPKLTYIEGQNLDRSTGSIKATYNDGTTEIVPLSDENITTGYIDYKDPGVYDVVIRYGGKTTYVTVTIVAKKVTNIIWYMSKTTYLVGESLTSDSSFEVYYDNGDWDYLNISYATVTGFDSSKVGTQELTLTYDGYSVKKTVTVQAKVVSSLTIQTKPKTEYYVGDSLDISNGKLKVTYNDNSTKTVSFSEATITGFDSSTTGTKTIRVTYEGKTVTYTITVKKENSVGDNVYRIYGDNRYATAFKVANTLKSTLGVSKFDTVIVTDGTNFADALAGSYLSAKKNAPILMTDKKDTNINNLVTYIKNNLKSGGTVYILGGTAAVSDSVDAKLSGYTVKRLAGANRYETNLKILEEAGVSGGHVIVCTGKNFADSLSASATGLPILLVDKSLSDAQKQFLSKSRASLYVIAGGTSAVSQSIGNELLNYGSTYRLAGSNRYATSMMIANMYFSNPDNAVLALATNFPDGLSGGALAYALDAPLLLTNSKYANYYVTGYYTKNNGVTSGYVLGGPGLIDNTAVRYIFSMSSSATIKNK